MKKWKLVSALALGAAAGGTVYYAKKNPEKTRRQAEISGDKAVTKLLRGMANVLPSVPVTPLAQYASQNFMPGQEEFRENAKRGVKWSLGYARRSLIPEGFTGEGCFVGGFLSIPPNRVTGVLDDQAVRVICLDDNSWRGAAVFAVIDCIGLSAPDVREIRARLADYAKENNIKSINVSATHCHSAVDTQGLWGDLPEMLKNNIRALREKRPQDIVSGKNPAFMENLIQKTVEAIREAHSGMKKGALYYTQTEEFPHARDKRKPDVVVPDIGKLHFVPSDGGRETVAAFMAAHPVCVGDDNTLVSSDYIYFIEEEVNKAGADFLFFQGPQLAVATNRDHLPEDLEGEGYQRYGRHVGRFLMSLPAEKGEKLAPLLNIRTKEIYLPCDNAILAAIVKLGIVGNQILDNNGEECFVSEVGYAELGKQLRIGIVPGELAPELALGGAFSAEESYNREEWTLPPMRDMLPDDVYFKVIGLCNDSIGYILPDNDYGSLFAAGHYEESVSAGKRAGSTVVRGFAQLVEECKRMPMQQS